MTNKKTTRFSVTIYDDCGANSDFLKSVALHNGGKTNLTLDDFEGFARVNKTLLPLSWANVKIHRMGEVLEVWDGGKCTLQIEEREMYELKDDIEPLTAANGFGALADG